MPIIIDITSDTEPDESPNKTLRSFQPRKERVAQNGGEVDDDVGDVVTQYMRRLASDPRLKERTLAEDLKRRASEQQVEERRRSLGLHARRERSATAVALQAGEADYRHSLAGILRDEANRQRMPGHSHGGERLDSHRVSKFNEFHAKEVLRRRTVQTVRNHHDSGASEPVVRHAPEQERGSVHPDAAQPSNSVKRNVDPGTKGPVMQHAVNGPEKNGVRSESAQLSNNEARSSMSKRTVLSGPGLAIIDDLPAPAVSADQGTDNVVRHPKRPASSAYMPESTLPKRQKMTETPDLHEKHRQRIADEAAKQAARQLEGELELAASQSSDRPQRTSAPQKDTSFLRSERPQRAGAPQNDVRTVPSDRPQRASVGQNDTGSFTSDRAQRVSAPLNDASSLAFDRPQRAGAPQRETRPQVAPQPSSTSVSTLVPSTTGHGEPFTPADDVLLAKLKESGLKWKAIHAYFPNRSGASVQVRYSSIVKRQSLNGSAAIGHPPQRLPQRLVPPTTASPVNAEGYQAPARRERTSRGGGPSVLDGFVSWSQVKQGLSEESETEIGNAAAESVVETGPLARQDRVHPTSMSRLLRHRELGVLGGRYRAPGLPDELKNHVFSDYTPTKHFMSTSGDVTCLAWAGDSEGECFAAASVAISDDRSMQYNSGRNLLIGNTRTSTLQELPEHHIVRPTIDTEDNINGLHAMRESQDSRLFMTVAAVAFSPDSKRMYSGGGDKKVRMYKIPGNSHKEAKCRYEIEHPAAVDLLSVSNHGLLATACHTNIDGSVRVYDCEERTYDLKLSLSPSRIDTTSSSAQSLFPSALKWGVAAQHSKFLLAGYSSDIAGDTSGETALWNVETAQRIPLSTVTRNVFDVAWNPSPSSASTAFAVASTPAIGKSYRNKRSVIQLYAPGQSARQVIEWECPALDINDVVYCPYDSNMTAAGATDGKVYIWDTRFASRAQSPLHVLAHEESVNVLDHREDKEVTDTGIRFLSWGATSSRLYSGSSDGVVKVWNPYRSTGNALVNDVATFQTAIMSGAFSPNHRSLLIGEECGRINLLSVGYQDEYEDSIDSIRSSSKFKLHAAPEPAKPEVSPLTIARDLVQSKQIDLRSMGALPIRQAVQGSQYNGPYLIPSKIEYTEAERVYSRALDAQHVAESELMRIRSSLGLPSDQDAVAKAEAAVKEADSRVKAAQAALDHLQYRHDGSVKLEPVAAENQRVLRAAGREQMKLERVCPTERCKLDCNYLPKVQDDARVPDTCRSEQRIPAALRALPGHAVDLTELNCKQLFHVGLAGRCKHCPNAIAAPSEALRRHFKMLCQQRCASIKAAFTATCNSCSAPMRGAGEVEEGTRADDKLCERCAFACFRCSQPLRLRAKGSSGDARLSCKSCGLTWEPSVLGYELVNDSARNC